MPLDIYYGQQNLTQRYHDGCGGEILSWLATGDICEVCDKCGAQSNDKLTDSQKLDYLVAEIAAMKEILDRFMPLLERYETVGQAKNFREARKAMRG